MTKHMTSEEETTDDETYHSIPDTVTNCSACTKTTREVTTGTPLESISETTALLQKPTTVVKLSPKKTKIEQDFDETRYCSKYLKQPNMSCSFSSSTKQRRDETRELLQSLGGWKSLLFTLMGLAWGMMIMHVYDEHNYSRHASLGSDYLVRRSKNKKDSNEAYYDYNDPLYDEGWRVDAPTFFMATNTNPNPNHNEQLRGSSDSDSDVSSSSSSADSYRSTRRRDEEKEEDEDESNDENEEESEQQNEPSRRPNVLKIKEGQWPTSKYTHFQGLGFQIYTGGAPAYLDTDVDADDDDDDDDDDVDHDDVDDYDQHSNAETMDVKDRNLITDDTAHSKANNSSSSTAKNETNASPNQRKRQNSECIGLHSYGHVQGELQCYLGHKDPVSDVHHRLQIMKDAVERAYEESVKDDPTVLKVFIAPEFFWRGKNGAYLFNNEEVEEKMRAEGKTEDQVHCGAVCQILRGLEQLVADVKYEDWLFVFGTVIASETLPQGNDYDYLFYNFAPVYKGYDPLTTTAAGKRFLVPKRYVSGIDFLTPRRHFNDTIAKELRPFQDTTTEYDDNHDNDTTVFNPYDLSQTKYDYDMWIEYKDELSRRGYAIIEYNWFLMDDIAFTIEICLDHRYRSALDAYTANVVTGSNLVIPSGSSSTSEELEYVPIPSHQAQISLVSSAGMVVMPSSLALAQNGTILLQDGMENVVPRMFWENDSETCTQGLQFEGGSEAVQRMAFLSPTEVVFEYRIKKDSQYIDLYPTKDAMKHALKKSFSTKMYDPQIVVYPPIPITTINN